MFASYARKHVCYILVLPTIALLALAISWGVPQAHAAKSWACSSRQNNCIGGKTCILVIDGGTNFYYCCVAGAGNSCNCLVSTVVGSSCAIQGGTYTACTTCYSWQQNNCPGQPCTNGMKVSPADINTCTNTQGQCQ